MFYSEQRRILLSKMIMNNYFYNDIIKGKNKIIYNQPEQNFMKNLQVLKDLLIQDNYTNIKNLSQSNYNNNQIFSYLKGIIRRLILKNDKLSERVKQLEKQLTKINPSCSALNKFQEENPFHLGEAGMKLHNFVPLKSRTADNFNKKFIQPTVFEQRSNPLITYGPSANDNRQNIKKQSKQIDRFISGELVKSLVQDRQKKSSILKDMIVKLYLRWNDLNKRVPVIKSNIQIKSMITNQLKKNFPNIDHNDKYYRGISFRQDLILSSKLKIQQLSSRSVKSFNKRPEPPIKNAQRNNFFNKQPTNNIYIIEDDDYPESYGNKQMDNQMIDNYSYPEYKLNNNKQPEQKLLNDSDYYQLLEFQNTAVYPF